MGLLKLFKNAVGGGKTRYSKWKNYKALSGRSKRQLLISNIDPERPVEGEEEYVKYWNVFTKRVDRYSYRLFFRFMGNKPFIIPEDIGKFYIEMYLNPLRYRPFYSDKNLYPQWMDKQEYFPKTIARRIEGGVLLNDSYLPLGNWNNDLPFDKLILKPSVDSDSGRGVRLFTKDGNEYVSEGDVMTSEFLYSYGDDFIVQEAVTQHPFFAQFNESSVNTMRLCGYRSVRTEKTILTGGILRIGAKGRAVDNAHAGGRFVKINIDDGSLGHQVFDQNGTTCDSWNDINFNHFDFKIPEWESIKEMALWVIRQNRHCRLLALDVTLTPDGQPVLIEENCGGFGYWYLQFTGQDVFAGHTDEVVEYCLAKEKKRRKNIN